MELAPITFTYDGTDYTSRRVTIGDFAAMREHIRRSRIGALPPGSGADALAKTVAAPVLNDEMSEYMLSPEGQQFFLFRAVHAMDQRFTPEIAERMVFERDPFVQRLYVESKIIADPTSSSNGPGA